MTKKLQRLPTMSSSLLIFVVISLMLMHSEAASDAVYNTCNTKGGSNYTKGSALDMNVQHVFTTLPNAAASNQGYNSTVYGRAPNTVYALAQCRGDTTASQCLSCLQDAVVSLQNLCGRFPGGQVWFDNCFFRWENNTNFFGQLDINSGVSLINTANASSNTIVFSNSINELLSNLIEKVAMSNNSRRYASGTFIDSSFHKIYALVQCWKDINIDDCKYCLFNAMHSISAYATSLGGQRLTNNCITRYETYSFFNATASPPPPPSPRILSPSPPLVSTNEGNSDSNSKSKLAIILGSVGGSVLLSLLVFSSCYFAVRRKHQAFQTEAGNAITWQSSFPNDDQQIFYNIGSLMAATSNFSDDCKLGEGGFGIVYKGNLPNGKEVAVKKLSVRSSQGKKEFLNEIRLIARVQHRNLVNLLGCCTDDSERILVYEYLTNKSLDKFLFCENFSTHILRRQNSLIGKNGCILSLVWLEVLFTCMKIPN